MKNKITMEDLLQEHHRQIEEKEKNETQWDEYFMSIAKAVGKNSKCYSRQIGSVLVKDKSIISTGYNGAPRGMRPCDKRWYEENLYSQYNIDSSDKDLWGLCPRRVLKFESGKGLEVCPASHSERNAILQAAKLGIATKDTTLYCHCCLPCKDCLVEIVNAGVKEVVYLNNGEVYDELGKVIVEETGLKVRAINFKG